MRLAGYWIVQSRYMLQHFCVFVCIMSWQVQDIQRQGGQLFLEIAHRFRMRTLGCTQPSVGQCLGLHPSLLFFLGTDHTKAFLPICSWAFLKLGIWLLAWPFGHSSRLAHSLPRQLLVSWVHARILRLDGVWTLFSCHGNDPFQFWGGNHLCCWEMCWGQLWLFCR